MKAPFQLYRLHEGLLALLDRIDDAENPIELAELTDAILKLEDDKVTRFAELRNAILNEEAKATAIKAEIARLSEMRTSAEKTVETIKSAALALLQLGGDQRIDFPTGGHIRWQNNSAPTIALAVLPEQLPEGWFETRTKIEHVVNRQAVLDAQALGTDLPKGITVTLGSHVRIK